MDIIDAMVVPANKEPVVGYGLDGQIFEAVGYDEVMEQLMQDGFRNVTGINNMLYNADERRLLIGDPNDVIPDKPIYYYKEK